MNRLTVLLIAVLYSLTSFSQGYDASYDSKVTSVNLGNNSVRGHLFLLPIAVKGKCIVDNDKIMDDPAYLYNYDITDKKVIISSSASNLIDEVGIHDVKEIEFVTSQGKISYETNSAIIENELLKVLVKMKNKYTLYKYEPALNKLEEPVYIILFPDNQIHKTKLHRKDIKELLESNPQSAYFFNNHKKDKVDENFLVQIITYLNYF